MRFSWASVRKGSQPAPGGPHHHKEACMKRGSRLSAGGSPLLKPHPLGGSLHKGYLKMKGCAKSHSCCFYVISFSRWFSSPSNPGCRLICLAHLWSVLLSSSCTRKMSHSSASVYLLILHRKEPVRGKRLSPQCSALRDLLKPSPFLLSIPLMWHKSLQQRNGFSILRFALGTLVAFSCPVCCELRSSAAKEQQGNPGCYPWLSV